MPARSIDAHLRTPGPGLKQVNSECPTCREPVWRRQVTPDHTIAAIVQVYKAGHGGTAAVGKAVVEAERKSAAKPQAKAAAQPSRAVRKPEAEKDEKEKKKEEPQENVWLTSGHPWLGQRVRLFFDAIRSDAVCVRWLPGTADDPPLWHVLHDDGDEEDLEAHEMREAMEAHSANLAYSREWRTDHPWVGSRVRRSFRGHAVDGTVQRWLPKAKGRRKKALWHVRHDDGDEEDVEENPLSYALVMYEKRFEAHGMSLEPPTDNEQGDDSDDESSDDEMATTDADQGRLAITNTIAEEEDEVVAEAEGLKLELSSRSNSGYKGVSKLKGVSSGSKGYFMQFRSKSYNDGRAVNKYFARAVDAAVAYARLAAEDAKAAEEEVEGDDENVAEEERDEEEDDEEEEEVVAEAEGLKLELSSKSNSGYKGVSKIKTGKGYQMQFRSKSYNDGKNVSKTFARAVDAAVAYARLAAESAKAEANAVASKEAVATFSRMATAERKAKQSAPSSTVAMSAQHCTQPVAVLSSSDDEEDELPLNLRRRATPTKREAKARVAGVSTPTLPTPPDSAGHAPDGASSAHGHLTGTKRSCSTAGSASSVSGGAGSSVTRAIDVTEEGSRADDEGATGPSGEVRKPRLGSTREWVSKGPNTDLEDAAIKILRDAGRHAMHVDALLLVVRRRSKLQGQDQGGGRGEDLLRIMQYAVGPSHRRGNPGV